MFEDIKQDTAFLKFCLDNIKGKFVLSYNDDEYIRSLYSNYEIIPVERNNNITKDS